jgi:dethiobiotin synthetase
MKTEKSPTLIWVVGDNTNVGKTTISAALIRVFNQMSVDTIGFKPYAGARLMDVIDLLQDIASGDGQLVGRDARQMAKASPLITTDLLEVVNPSWRLSYPVRDASIFVRKGSSQIGQREIKCSEHKKSLWTRRDMLELNRVIHLPIENMRATYKVSADKIDFEDQAVQAASFDRLLQLKPQVVVCEGAGRLLPVWSNGPIAKHLFFVLAGELHFFPNVGIRVSMAPDVFRPITVAALTGHLNSRAIQKAPIPIVESNRLEGEMDAFVRPFVTACINTKVN